MKVLKLTGREIVRIHEKLDKLIEISSAQEQHLKELNGTISRHEKKFESIDKEIDNNGRKIAMAQGGLIAIGFISTIVGIFVAVKSLGMF